MYAVDDLSDAIDVTREFLTPIQASTWLKLAVVVFFLTGLGVGGGLPTIPSGDVTPGPEEEAALEELDVDITAEEVVLAAAILAGIALLLWLVFAFVGAIMEFVFVASLRQGSVHVRRYARENLGRGVRLFGFRVIVGLLAASVVVVPAVVLLDPTGGLDEVDPSAIGVLVLLGFVAYLAYALVMRLTTEFVVPVMLLERRGVLDGWKRFWPTLRSNFLEYVVYVVLATIISFVASIAVNILAIIPIIVLLIPIAILAVILFVFAGPIGIALVGLLVVATTLAMLLLVALFEMPVVAYIRYYALLVLGDTNNELDLIPEQRRSIRASDDWDAGSEAADDGRERDSDVDDADPQPSTDRDGESVDDDERSEADDDRTSTGDGWDDATDWDDDDDDEGGWGYRDEDDTSR